MEKGDFGHANINFLDYLKKWNVRILSFGEDFLF